MMEKKKAVEIIMKILLLIILLKVIFIFKVIEFIMLMIYFTKWKNT